MTKPPSAEALVRLAKDVADRQATIEFDRRVGAEVHTFQGQGRLAVVDGTSLQLTTRPGQLLTIPLAATRRVSVNRRGVSTLVGVGIGLVVGFVVPLVALVADDSGPEGPRSTFFAEGLILGTAVGGLLGLVAGHRTTYTF